MIRVAILASVFAAALIAATVYRRCPGALRWLAAAMLCKAIVRSAGATAMHPQTTSDALLVAIDLALSLAIIAIALRDDRADTLLIGGAHIAGLAGNLPLLLFGSLVEPARIVLFDVPSIIAALALTFAVIECARRDPYRRHR
ncbi:hypothetical protein B2G71_07225 [Novosphingobium sp. PC22D]|uniref:hypothetical protein n=1 Tax=Novosphingobium sp. PC22D TaxID=1962403 RepID=UPI000BEFCFDD|nr:hypothetical protein [Novosphingobium sp. PC22D]PEQ13224.1 hypothetical protein B2G71_07225 [Novosphingobium sp. PC22D]